MANVRPHTIVQSFYHPLPDLDLNPAPSLQAHANSTTAEETDPPRVWIEKTPTSWHRDEAHPLIIAVRHAPAVQTLIPAIERPFWMQTEADVIRATTLYFLHSINQTINTRFRETIFCAAEDRGSGNLRCDLIWRIKDNSGRTKNIAVLELKNRGILLRHEFMCARTDRANSSNKIARAWQEPNQTFLRGNARLVSKQAAAYALERRTRFVAIFDWDSLFLYEFAAIDPGSWDTVGSWAYGTWVDYDARPTNFRMVLLGWLFAACKQAGLR